ncbi:hypothetical protein DM860_002761 [Cuscuta australis]|uniref:RING-type E3 ubiquitin transferase n=1 Tax=Cuscuta australis TaxID=267555 RepID=A0A328D3U1_9ASTE|nr:hypothetical protein DM860_002761 [Cuscuta australis]
MVVASSESFPSRKRQPSAGSIAAQSLSDRRLLQTLLAISLEISSAQPIRYLMKKNTSSMIRRSKLMSVLFEELLRCPATSFQPTAVLCFEELYIALQRVKALMENCRNSSKMWLLMRIEPISNSFHELAVELSTVFDILPAKDLSLSEDLVELICLIRKQSSEKDAYLDSADKSLLEDVLRVLDGIKQKIPPELQNLAEIFHKLTLMDSTSCRDEIESLEEEIQSQSDGKSKSDILALISLVRYAKCVLYGASTPRNDGRRRKTTADVTVPADFRCPISLDLMREPVVVSTGQTYDRSSISLWIQSGHNTCPKTGQTLTGGQLIPNVALKRMIAMWCREQKIQFDLTEPHVTTNGAVTNKAAWEATKMTVSFLVHNLKASRSVETANRTVHELRVLAKTDSDSRACIAEAGALPLLVKLLGSGHPSLQVNAVTAILNLSILDANKERIMETDGVLNGVIEVLRSGATWEAKGNAAATVFSLTGVSAYRKCLGRKTRVVKGLIALAREGPTDSKRDAMVAILNLAGDREAVGKLIEGGVVEMAAEAMDALPEEAATLLEAVVKRGGLAAVAAAFPVVKRLMGLLREGTERVRESAAATLVNMCRKGGSEVAAELAAVQGTERVIWEMMRQGTGRGRRKAATLLRILRRWAAGGGVNEH